MDVAERARAVERDIFGALLGTLAGVLIVRLLLIFMDLGPYGLLAIVGIGAWSGAFAVHWSGEMANRAVQSVSGFVARLQKPFLTAMLWLLGASAVIGVVTVLTTNDELLARLLGTTFATAIAASLLWRASSLVDREAYQLGALFGMGVVFLVYMLIMPLIWDIGDDHERMAMTAGMLALTAPAAILFMRILHHASTRIAGLVGVVLYAIVVAMFLVAIWHPIGSRWGPHDWWWGAAWSLTWLGGLGIASLCGFTWNWASAWRWIGMAASIFAWMMVANRYWKDAEVLTACIVSVAVAVAHASLVSLIQLRPGQYWLRIGTIASTVTAAFLLDLDFILRGDIDPNDSILLRLTGAAMILASSGTLGLAILAVLNRSMVVQKTDGSFRAIHVICPRCQKKQLISLGGASCASCQLTIRIEIEFPEEMTDQVADTPQGTQELGAGGP